MSSNRSPTSQPWYRKRTQGGAPRQVEEPITVSPPPPLGDVIRTLQVSDLAGRAREFAGSAKILHARTVTSYNWVDNKASESTIMIPGKPPLWTPQTVPSRLKEDSGSYFRDRNAARYPKHPMEPTVVASLDSDPTIPSEVDFVACGNTLRNLLRFIRGEDKSFRILAYKVRETVFLVRRENSPTELIPGVRGFGHAFPEANTTWEPEVKGSSSHERVVRYSFGGMELLVRFGADGYMKENRPALENTSVEKPPFADVETLATSFFSNTISPSPASPSPNAALKITSTTRPIIPQSSIFDLKTRSIYTRSKRDHLAEVLPRLWVTQIPTSILAFHTQGLFVQQDIEIRDVREEVKEWEEEHSAKLAKLAALLSWIKELLESSEVGGKVEICYRGQGAGGLEVRRQLADVGEVLSADVRKRWEQRVVVSSKKKEGFAEEGAKN
ncbi:hypothetical protein MMYC01_205187 [Madurella mycetomatis]|uniref:Geranylgeranyl pyrophosphate synthetase n=1 Tax=Madurella mycetomatis TaxID=100816 RepID=A0A175WB69_9PEZI|nr:hypothetical protein MMYC01_205187 [Madurella mycetomatis]